MVGPRRRQHRRRCAVLRRGWEARSADEDDAQRADRIRCAGVSFYWASRGQAQVVGNKALFLWQKFPKFVLGFLLISGLATAAFFSKEQTGALANLSRWAFLLTFAGVGLRTNFKMLSKQGLKPFAVRAIGEVVIAGFTLGLVLVAQGVFGW